MSENNAKIIIENRQKTEDGNDKIRISEPCRFMKKGDIVYILYKSEGVANKITIKNETVTVTKMGEFSSEMVYRKGETTSFLYKMPYGTMDMKLKTKRAEVLLSENGGEIILCYELLFSGTKTENDMRIKIELK